jgi:tetrahydromethanopterin S-methyltransferase subunit G
VHCARTLNTVAEERQRVGEREGGAEGIKYGIVGIEYEIEII